MPYFNLFYCNCRYKKYRLQNRGAPYKNLKILDEKSYKILKISIRFKIYRNFSTILGTFGPILCNLRLFGQAIGTSLHLVKCVLPPYLLSISLQYTAQTCLSDIASTLLLQVMLALTVLLYFGTCLSASRIASMLITPPRPLGICPTPQLCICPL